MGGKSQKAQIGVHISSLLMIHSIHWVSSVTGHRAKADLFRILSWEANILSAQAGVYPSPLLESLPSPKMTASPDHGQGRTAAGWTWGSLTLCSLRARRLSLFGACHSACISGSDFFLSTSLEASHILLTLTTYSLILPFLLSPALYW